jgi:hypothetical protein
VISKNTFIAFLAIGLLFTSNFAEARKRTPRKSRSRGPIIVHRILNLKGVALIDGIQAPEFAGIKEGNLIETKADSMLLARMVGLGMFRLGENSQVKLLKYLNREKLRMEALRGDVLIFLRRPGDHQIIAGDQVITIQKDAIVRIKMNQGEDAQICACKGEFKSAAKGSAKQSSAAESSPTPVQLSPVVLSSPANSPANLVVAAEPSATPEPIKEVAVVTPQMCCKGIDLDVMDSLYSLP